MYGLEEVDGKLERNSKEVVGLGGAGVGKRGQGRGIQPR